MTLTASESVDLMTITIREAKDAAHQAEVSRSIGLDPEYWENKANRYKALLQKLLNEPCEPT